MWAVSMQTGSGDSSPLDSKSFGTTGDDERVRGSAAAATAGCSTRRAGLASGATAAAKSLVNRYASTAREFYALRPGERDALLMRLREFGLATDAEMMGWASQLGQFSGISTALFDAAVKRHGWDCRSTAAAKHEARHEQRDPLQRREGGGGNGGGGGRLLRKPPSIYAFGALGSLQAPRGRNSVSFVSRSRRECGSAAQ